MHATALGAGDTPYTDRFSFNLDLKTLPAGVYVFAAMATVDSSWANRHSQSKPPGVPPQSHIVKARTINGYNATNNGIEIDGKTAKWFSEFLCLEIDETGGIVPKTSGGSKDAKVKKSNSPTGDESDDLQGVFVWTLFVISALLLSSLSLVCVGRWAYRRVYLGKYETTEIVELTSMNSSGNFSEVEKYKDDAHDPTVDGDDIEIASNGKPVFRSIGVI